MPHITQVGPSNAADYPVAVSVHTSRAHLITGPTVDVDVESPEPPYGDRLKDDLAAECKARGLPVSGTKDDLIARLTDHDTDG